jgi:hypothetical protein
LKRIICNNMQFPLAHRLLPYPYRHHLDSPVTVAWQRVHYCLLGCLPGRGRS